jgi:hypothetical protein
MIYYVCFIKKKSRSEQLVMLFGLFSSRILMAVHELTRLNIMTYNANSIHPKKLNFFDFLLENSIDIALINETHLMSGTRLCQPNYVCYRFDCICCPKGSVSIMVRYDLPHTLHSSFRTFPRTPFLVRLNLFMSTWSLTLTISQNIVFICGDFNSRHTRLGVTPQPTRPVMLSLLVEPFFPFIFHLLHLLVFLESIKFMTYRLGLRYPLTIFRCFLGWS